MSRRAAGFALLAAAALATAQPKKPEFDLPGGEPVKLKGHEGKVYSVAINPEGTVVYSGGFDKTLRVWPQLKSAGKEQTWAGFGKPLGAGVVGIQFVPPPKGKTKSTAAVVRTGEELLLADMAAGRGLARLSGGIIATAVSADGRWIGGSYHPESTLLIWSAQTGAKAARIQLTSKANAVGFSPDGAWAVVDTDQQMLRAYDLKTGKADQKYKGQPGLVVAIAFLPGGKEFVSAGHADEVWLWDFGNGSVTAKLPGHEGTVTALAVSPDGERVLAATGTGVVKVWDVAARKLVGEVKAHEGPVHAVAVAPNGRWVATAGADEMVVLSPLPR